MFRVSLATLFIIALLLPCFIHISSTGVYAYADFGTWVNRSTRHYSPIGYDIDGSMAKQVYDWRGIRGIGSMVIPNGSIESLAPENWTDITIYPEKYFTGTVEIGAEDPAIVIGNQTEGLFYQHPFQSSTMYGRLSGFNIPGGRIVNMAIRCQGYE